ncbi:hypothetical protein [Streptomyces sp. NBC_00572]|uniref:hypothetical protein n=1 Tax=Streptomyces sp. NBC_00572 TaxID=2903664 RepID=UPI0022548D71|nr:hypothetical protein [Streptomyces sp. NBC_00572]MCX4986616.1 hypothetical protein [Streptomyces sp. NBC_00572]
MAEDLTNSNSPDSVPTTGDGDTPSPTTGDGDTPSPTTGDGDTPSSETQAIPASVLAVGGALIALLTLIVAGATLYLTFRSDDRETAEAQDRVQDRVEDRERLYANEVGFYRTGDQAAVANGSTHFMPMRLVLPSKQVWWDLQGPEPCKQVWIPYDSLISEMHEKLPNLSLSESDLADLQLRFQDPAGRAWSIDRTGAISATKWTTSTGKEGTQLDRSDLLVYPNEPWMTDAQVSPGCGPA